MDMTLGEFLLARIDDDERLMDDTLWYTRPDGTRIRPRIDGEDVEVSKARIFRRELAECVAKRRIVEVHMGHRGDCDRDYQFGHGPCETLAILAAIYADHPDYREEWHAVDAS